MVLLAQGDLTGLIGYILAGFAVLAGAVGLLYKTLLSKYEAVEKDQKLEIADLRRITRFSLAA